jgi:hypothetical protein
MNQESKKFRPDMMHKIDVMVISCAVSQVSSGAATALIEGPKMALTNRVLSKKVPSEDIFIFRIHFAVAAYVEKV